MKCNRRRFLRTAGGIVVLGLGQELAAGNLRGGLFTQGIDTVFRVAVLFEADFPPADSLRVAREDLAGVLSGWKGDFIGVADLPRRLGDGYYDLLVNPYGGAFPAESWGAIRRFLEGGGNLLNLGGVPFSVPVRREGNSWKSGIPQTAYHKELGITQSFPLPRDEIGSLSDSEFSGSELSVAAGCVPDRVFELYYRFTTTRDYPDEDGTSGQRDAVVRVLVSGVSPSGDVVSAPVVVIDRLLGDFAGGRWILANFSGSITTDALRHLVELALTPPVEFTVNPTFATYLPYETPAFNVSARGILPGGDIEGECHLILADSDGKQLDEKRIEILSGIWEAPVVFGAADSPPREPGFYRVSGLFQARRDSPAAGRTARYETGFWIRDLKLLAQQPPLTVENGYFKRAGKPFPVTGTSYMSSDVHRKFLFEPNPAVWDADFTEMKNAGINMVRTGIWTGWKNIMLDAGHVSEHVLRSIDAFMLTAARHEIPVIFTFFAFLPEAWGGVNPYMDPRSVNAQEDFVSTIADRFRNAGGIIWDLINEPSFSSPAQLWYCRPNYDRYESAAWEAWLQDQLPGVPPEDRAGALRERYRMTAEEDLGLPPLEDFTEMNIYGRKRPFRVSDYRLFAQEMFAKWSGRLADVLKRGRKSPQLVTVGQDEGGTYERPGPHFFADTVDFTSVHNWWYNDNLLWDSIITTVPGKANLVEETGIMFYETADSRAWRTENEARDLLERKLALSFAAGGAGFISWIWNTNPYMDSENEAGIGLKRADGTIKPEFDVIRRYALYFRDQAGFMQGKSKEDVVLVIPHSNLFSTRNYAVEATRNAVRVMEYHCRVPVRAVSELKLHTLKEVPAVLLFPSPLVIDGAAWDALLALVRKGSTLVISGPIDDDRYLIPAARASSLGFSGEQRPVTAEEHLVISDREYRLGFRGYKMQKIKKQVIAGNERAASVVTEVGKGSVVYSPLPLELSDSITAIKAFYLSGLERARVRPELMVETDDPSVLVRHIVYRDHLMVVFVSEAPDDRTISYTHRPTGTAGTTVVGAGRTVVRFLGKGDGRMVSELNISKVS